MADDEERARMQRELRAMAHVNRQLQVQVAEATEQAKAAARRAGSSVAGTKAGEGDAASPVVQAKRLAGRAKRSVQRRGVVGAATRAARKAERKARRTLGR